MAASRSRQKSKASVDSLTREEQSFQRKREQLLRRYEGQFVAIYQGRVAGHGPDDEELAAQMYAKLGDVHFYIARVERMKSVYELPSPEVGS